ncbi:TetR/AcrR family transcriptional regulator [Pectobacterium punjabense]|uniref:TetR/AcrR family transcriptional regulator n=1 Tax=Pectobacterium punjabense TaxID=2108399 RepID=UPI0019692583|nr:TetR/AcrR family transcriptional regulator [Pectobacterium punjabense]MBN3136255.1 TetR/AcrR family transcriptional regulator [Pectobacterium punjabense]MCE5381943.1 TetR/AcrR family transcriptional regulator [Pectobacterium punjabense]MDG0797482.1 TetR/AcrR family transcriptional regulator [Pectobacterium punjabense]
MKETTKALKDKILDGAIELFIEKGIEKVTTRELAEHVGISRSHLYHYFPDWQTLSIEALTAFMQADLEEVAAEIATLPPKEKLYELVKNYLPDTTDVIWNLYGSLWQLAVHNTAYEELAHVMTEKWSALLEEIIASGIASGAFKNTDTQRVSRQLDALLNGYSDHLIINPTPDDFKQAIEDIEDFIQRVLLSA